MDFAGKIWFQKISVFFSHCLVYIHNSLPSPHASIVEPGEKIWSARRPVPMYFHSVNALTKPAARGNFMGGNFTLMLQSHDAEIPPCLCI